MGPRVSARPREEGIVSAPTCPKCGKAITRALDLPYGWWEWDDGRYVRRTAAAAGHVDVAPWVHWDCMEELREFHPQDFQTATTRVAH